MMVIPDVSLGRIGQLGIVVRDIRASMEHYWRALGIGHEVLTGRHAVHMLDQRSQILQADRRHPVFRRSTRPLVPPKTLTESVYERLRDDIVNGLIKPGESFSTIQIARDMQVSSMPVRAALTRLQAEGLIVVTPHRGVTVTSISSGELGEAFAIRSRLEGLGIFLACPRMTEADREQLRRSLEEMGRLEKENDTRGWLKANEQFHQLIFGSSQNRKLVRLLLDLWKQARRGRIGARNIPGHMERRNAEHASILKALEAKDAERAERLMQDHIFAAGKEIVEFIAEQQLSGRS
jgi:DNA-binding GntR family transcriptional regulator